MPIKQTKIIITKIDNNIPVEENEIFLIILKKFNRNKVIKLGPRQIKLDLNLSMEFNDIMDEMLISYEIEVEKSQIQNLLEYRKRFIKEYGLKIKEEDKYYYDIMRIIFRSDTSNDEEGIRDMMLDYECAFAMMKRVFLGRERNQREGGKAIRYFEHLKGVMEIVLYEFPNPNLYKIVIALLHDSIEDIPGFTYEAIESIFGKYVADCVNAISKKEWDEYLTDFEKKIIDPKNKGEYKELKKIAKLRGADEYYGHMPKMDDNTLDVKLGDRLHNLRTLDHCPSKTITKKIKQTEKFFMPLAKVRNVEAYNLMRAEMDRLRKKYLSG